MSAEKPNSVTAGNEPPAGADREIGVAKPERIEATGADETPDQIGIEIDNALERPKEGHPGERGVKKD